MKVLWWAPAVLAADQLSKAVVVHSMARGESIPVIGDFFRITYIHNSGAAFGLHLGSPLFHMLISLVALGALAWLFWATPVRERVIRGALSVVLGGAVGNIVDRVRLHEVVDFLDVGLRDLRWPIFNLADSFVTVGVILLALSYGRTGKSGRSGVTDDSCSPEAQIAQG